MVEDALTEMDDILRERLAALKLDRERAQAALDRIRTQAAPVRSLSPEAVERFAFAMRDALANGATPFRKAYLRSVIDRIEVGDDLIGIIGDKATLEHAILNNGAARAGA